MIGLLAVALVLFGLSSAMAGERERVARLGAVIEYDTEVWRLSPPPRVAHMTFTCIARDCLLEPTVYAYARRLPAASAEETRFCDADGDGGRGRPILQPADGGPAGRIAFAATSTSTGCARLDEPILDACAEHAGIGYRFTTKLDRDGCGPAFKSLPWARFIDLVSGVRPAAAQ